MLQDQVAQIHKALGLTAAEVQALKSVRLVWQKLEVLRKQALKDDRTAQAYQDALAKSLATVRQAAPPLDVEEIVLDFKAFWAWYNEECARQQISELEARRGMPHMAWCAKWLPDIWKGYQDAVEAAVELPSPQNQAALRLASEKLLQAYVAAV